MNIKFIVVVFNPFPYQFFGFLEAVEVVDPDAFFLDGPHNFWVSALPFGLW